MVLLVGDDRVVEEALELTAPDRGELAAGDQPFDHRPRHHYQAIAV
jgi:hypothetical protein